MDVFQLPQVGGDAPVSRMLIAVAWFAGVPA